MAEVTKGRIFFSDSEKDVKKKNVISIYKERERERISCRRKVRIKLVSSYRVRIVFSGYEILEELYVGTGGFSISNF